MKKTPIKQSVTKTQLCIVCAQIAKGPRKVESTRVGVKQLDDQVTTKDLLLKYGGINIESGTICRSCWDKLSSLHTKAKSFYDLCQSNQAIRQTKLRGKRMAPSGTTPTSSVHKRKDLSTTPQSLSKIPTPISKTKCAKQQPNDPTDKISQQCTKETRRKRLFTDTSQSDDVWAHIIAEPNCSDGIAVGMEIEIEMTTNEPQDSSLIEQTNIISDQIIAVNDTTENNINVSLLNENLLSEQTDHGYMKPENAGLKKPRSQTDVKTEQPIHHDYLKSQKKPPKFNSFYDEIRKFINEYNIDSETISEEEGNKLLAVCVSMNVKQICETVISIESARKCLIGLLMNEFNQTASQMTCRKYNTSVLMQKSLTELKTFDWFTVVAEMKSRFPELMALMFSLILKKEDRNLYTAMEKVVPRLGTVYGILMQGRNQELSLIQRLNSSVLFDNICDVKVFDRLQKQGVCLGHNGSIYMMEIIGGKFNESVIELVRQNRRFRLIGDNINWTVGVHDQRVDHRGHMEHAFGSAVLVQNVDFSACDDDAPLSHFEDTPCQQFIPTTDDRALYKYDYTVLMSRVVLQFLPFFNMFEDIIPEKLSKPCDQNLKTKTKVIPLPVLYKNEQKHQDVVEILAFYENIVSDACDATGKDMSDLFIHIGGDQLTRERFSTAKTLRAHEDDRKDRFENLSPITFEFFHMHMNFLSMVFKTLYHDKSAQDIGTLKSLQNKISRSNVDSNVNTHYDADKDFFISVVDVHIVECFMEFFGMQDVNDIPTKNSPPVFDNTDQKKEWYFQMVGKLLDEYVFPNVSDDVEVEGTVHEVLLADGRSLSFCVPDETKAEEPRDGVNNYARRLMELGLHFKDLLDATKLPERKRHISLLKQTMLFFKSHRNKSKYAYEILRLLVHQICILTEKTANEEFYGMFVNTNGRFDGHIPADRRMEYLVKKVKEHIKHMFSSKTESNVKKRSSAIAGIADICERYDSVTNVLVRTHKHSDKSAHGDELILLETLRTIRPFEKTHGRHHAYFPDMTASISDSLNVQHYQEWINTRKEKFATELGN